MKICLQAAVSATWLFFSAIPALLVSNIRISAVFDELFIFWLIFLFL